MAATAAQYRKPRRRSVAMMMTTTMAQPVGDSNGTVTAAMTTMMAQPVAAKRQVLVPAPPLRTNADWVA